jgi:hypothetical protein
MNSSPNNLPPAQLAAHEALRKCLQNLEEAIASLLQMALSLPQGKLREQLLDQVSEFDSIADLMRQALDVMGD